jgi:hypothetical protein
VAIHLPLLFSRLSKKKEAIHRGYVFSRFFKKKLKIILEGSGPGKMWKCDSNGSIGVRKANVKVAKYEAIDPAHLYSRLFKNKQAIHRGPVSSRFFEK